MKGVDLCYQTILNGRESPVALLHVVKTTEVNQGLRERIL